MSVSVNLGSVQKEILNTGVQFGAGATKKPCAVSSGSSFSSDAAEPGSSTNVLSGDFGWWRMFPLALFMGGINPISDHVTTDMLWMKLLSLDRKSATSLDTENQVLFKFEKFQILLELAYREMQSAVSIRGDFFTRSVNADDASNPYAKGQNSLASRSLMAAANFLEQLGMEMNDYFSEFDTRQTMTTRNFVTYGRNPVMFMTALVRTLAFLSNVTHDEAFFQRTIEKVHILIYYLTGSPETSDVFEAKRVLIDFSGFLEPVNRENILEAIGRVIVKHKREAILKDISSRLTERGTPVEELNLLMESEGRNLDMIIKNEKDRITGLNNLMVNGTNLAVYSPALDTELSIEESVEGLKLPRLPVLNPKIRRIGDVLPPKEAIFLYARIHKELFMEGIAELRESFRLARAQMRERVEKK